MIERAVYDTVDSDRAHSYQYNFVSALRTACTLHSPLCVCYDMSPEVDSYVILSIFYYLAPQLFSPSKNQSSQSSAIVDLTSCQA